MKTSEPEDKHSVGYTQYKYKAHITPRCGKELRIVIALHNTDKEGRERNLQYRQVCMVG